jgi:O-antigen/teichoic acid export membrane protein
MSSLAKRFFNDSIIYALQPLLSKTFSYFLIPLYTAYLTPADFGNLNYILAIGSFFRCFVEMGLYTSFWKFKSKKGGYELSEVIFNINMAQFLLAFNILIIAFIIKKTIFNESLLAYLIIIYLISQTISIIFQSSCLVYRARFQPKKYLFATVFSTALLLCLNILFVAVLKWNFKGVIYSYIVGYSILAVLYIGVAGRNYGEWKINKKLTKEALVYGFPIMIGNIAALFITIASRFFIKEFSTDHELGLYSFGYKFGEIYYLILSNTFFMAWNSLRWEIYESPNGKNIFAKFYKYILIAFPLLGILLVPVLYGMAILMTVDQEYMKGILIMPIIVFSFVLQGFYYFNAMGLLFEAKTKKIMLIVILGGVLSVILNLLIIEPFGMYGAAISTFVAYFVMFIVCKYQSFKAYPIQRDKKMEIYQIVLIFLFTLVYVTMFRLIDNPLYIIIICFLLFFILIGGYFLFGILSTSEIIQIVKQLNFKKKKSESQNIIYDE